MPIFLILVPVCVLVFLAFLTDSFFGGLDFVSSRQVAKAVIKIIGDKKSGGGNFYDLGSAKGSFAARIAGALPNWNIIGIDDNWFRVVISKTRSGFLKNIKFNRENIFSANVSSADIIYIYLPKELMPDLQIKLQTELKPGATVITNRVSFPNWQPLEKTGELFIYQTN